MEQSGLSVCALSLADFFFVCVLPVTLCIPVYVYAPTSVHMSERMRLASQTCQPRERESRETVKARVARWKRGEGGERQSSNVHLRMKFS